MALSHLLILFNFQRIKIRCYNIGRGYATVSIGRTPIINKESEFILLFVFNIYPAGTLFTTLSNLTTQSVMEP